GEHLARDLGVPALVRFEQVKRHTRVEEGGGQDDEDREVAQPQPAVRDSQVGEKDVCPEPTETRKQGCGPGGERGDRLRHQRRPAGDYRMDINPTFPQIGQSKTVPPRPEGALAQALPPVAAERESSAMMNLSHEDSRMRKLFIIAAVVAGLFAARVGA